jgi:hypothetical protein
MIANKKVEQQDLVANARMTRARNGRRERFSKEG